MPNSLEPDQDRRFVGPDLGPNCLQRLSADDKSPLAWKDCYPSFLVKLFLQKSCIVGPNIFIFSVLLRFICKGHLVTVFRML